MACALARSAATARSVSACCAPASAPAPRGAAARVGGRVAVPPARTLCLCALPICRRLRVHLLAYLARSLFAALPLPFLSPIHFTPIFPFFFFSRYDADVFSFCLIFFFFCIFVFIFIVCWLLTSACGSLAGCCDLRTTRRDAQRSHFPPPSPLLLPRLPHAASRCPPACGTRLSPPAPPPLVGPMAKKQKKNHPRSGVMLGRMALWRMAL